MEKKEKNIKELAKGIMEEAKQRGYQDDATFKTSFHMLEVQVEMMDSLEKSFKEDGSTVSKEYVKGRENIYIHPAIREYTKICDSAFNKILKIKEIFEKYSSGTEDELNGFVDD